MISLTINGDDKSTLVNMGSLRIREQLNNASDTCNFSIDVYGSQTYRPELNDEVVVTADSIKIYGGVIIQIEKTNEGNAAVRYEVTCKDYTQYLDRRLIVERYTDQTLQEIILDLIDRYADTYGFTGTNVAGSTFNIKSIAFNEISMSDALTKLARLTNYSWYVDYDKDIHFFPKNTEVAPFTISDVNENYIYDSISINDDLSQIRNKVKIRGGEGIGEERDEQYAGNGSQLTFPLGSKFSEKPTVTVDGVSKTVGVDFIDQDADFQVMWSYQQKYIRFTAGNTPPEADPGDTNIVVTGLPLIPIVVQIQDPQSVTEYGVYEYTIYDDKILSRNDAIKYAQTELAEYANTVANGSFETYRPGLHSGQTIEVDLDNQGINEKFIIQSVAFKQVTKDLYIWSVQLATYKTISILDVLQQLLFKERIAEGEDEVLLNFFQLNDIFRMTDEITNIQSFTTADYVWEQEDPGSDSYTNPIVWDQFTWDA